MDVLLVIDMQCGLLRGAPKHNLDGVVDRINALAAAIRARCGETAERCLRRDGASTAA